MMRHSLPNFRRMCQNLSVDDRPSSPRTSTWVMISTSAGATVNPVSRWSRPSSVHTVVEVVFHPLRRGSRIRIRRRGLDLERNDVRRWIPISVRECPTPLKPASDITDTMFGASQVNRVWSIVLPYCVATSKSVTYPNWCHDGSLFRSATAIFGVGVLMRCSWSVCVR